MKNELREKNHTYWEHRAKGYSEVNQEELAGVQHRTWKDFLQKEITGHFGDVPPESLSVYDIGAGPGFLSIVLTEAGYRVTAVDYSEEMIREARENAGTLSDSITYVRADACATGFPENACDVIVTRNLTWNLPDPKAAYNEWMRILKPGGLLLLFDANWYHYLVDDKARKSYEEDRKQVALQGYSDYNIGEDFDAMERIASAMPLTGVDRPDWDKEVLTGLGAKHIFTQEDVGALLYSDKEKTNYSATPLFMVRAVKG